MSEGRPEAKARRETGGDYSLELIKKIKASRRYRGSPPRPPAHPVLFCIQILSKADAPVLSQLKRQEVEALPIVLGRYQLISDGLACPSAQL